MESYYFCHRILKSNIHIPELHKSRSPNEIPLSFDLGDSREQLLALNWLHRWDSNGNPALYFGRQNLNHILHFPELADFIISADTIEIHCHPLPDVPEHTIRHLLLDQVLPRCLAHQGHLLLHASAAATEKGLILFVGASGAGKSTLAGYFHQSGYPALSDDCMLLEEEGDHVKAIPSYGGVRLWEDSKEFLFPESQETSEMAHYSSKQRIPLAEDEGREYKNNVLAIIFLSPLKNGEETAVGLKPVSMREGYMELLKQTYQLDVTDAQKVAEHAQALGRIMNKFSLFQLSMPHDYSLLPAARQLILDTVLSNRTNP
jgi:hypothetical protein